MQARISGIVVSFALSPSSIESILISNVPGPHSISQNDVMYVQGLASPCEHGLIGIEVASLRSVFKLVSFVLQLQLMMPDLV